LASYSNPITLAMIIGKNIVFRGFTVWGDIKSGISYWN